jgi:hypothetical protein
MGDGASCTNITHFPPRTDFLLVLVISRPGEIAVVAIGFRLVWLTVIDGLKDSFRDALSTLKAKSAILDGEIVCLDAEDQFKELLYRRGRAVS